MSEAFKVTGLQELNRNLVRLADDVQRKHLRGAVAAGARLIRDAAVRNFNAIQDLPDIEDETGRKLPRIRTGKLARSIYSKWIQEASGNGRQSFLVSVRRGKRFRAKKRGKGMTEDKDAYYWTWVEFGHVATGPKKLKGGAWKRQKARKALKAAGRFVAARPFLRPALENNKTAAIEAVRAELAKRIAEGLSK